MNSEKLCESISKITSGEVILMFSRGKDSIASYYQIKKYFHKIHLVYKYRVPELKFVQESIEYFEHKFEQKIIQIPHPAFYNQINKFLFQTPERAQLIHQMGLPTHQASDYDTLLPIDLNCPKAFIATGIRLNDSPMRRMVINKHGAFNAKKRTFYPIYDWSNEDIRICLKENEIKLPIDYDLWGKSMDGLDYRFIKPLKDNLPEDYEIVKKYFPLIDLEIMRYEQI